MTAIKALLKKSIVSLQQRDEKIKSLEDAANAPIAIIGMSGRFPGAASLDAFWQLIAEGRDALSELDNQRWDMSRYYSKVRGERGKIYTRRQGLLTEVDQFCPALFGISDNEARYMDPQQRLLLEQAWLTFENAGQNPNGVKGTSTGVFIGQMNSDYRNLVKHSDDLHPYFGIGNAVSAASGRLSYVYGLEGPSIAIDTACSSSLVAVHLASQALRQNECRQALAGGVNLILSPEGSIASSVANMLSQQGRCNAFGDGADGYIRAEGCSLVLLKKLSDAEAEGDNILAVIRGSAVNQDGHSHGFSAPSGPSQQAVMKQALARAGVNADQVSYIETHGTGTALGDPVEVQAIDAVYGKGQTPLALGAVKANIGHCESAAGIAGLVKLVLMMRHEQLPPICHLDQLNPHFPEFSKRLQFCRGQASPWTVSGKRLAGLSSFGYSGTNAHLLIEQYNAPVKPHSALPEHLLCLSAHSADALKAMAESLEQWLAGRPSLELGDICYSLNRIRGSLAYRLSVSCDSIDALRQGLKEATIEQRKSAPIVLRFGAAKSDVLNTLALYPGFADTLAQTKSLFDDGAKGAASQSLLSGYLTGRFYLDCGVRAARLIAAGRDGVAALVHAGVIDLTAAAQLAAALDNGESIDGFIDGLSLNPPQFDVIDDKDNRYPGKGGQAAKAWLKALCREKSSAALQSTPDTAFVLDIADSAGSGQLLQSLGRLFVHGCDIRWDRVYPPSHHQLLSLPAYPFERSRYWLPEYIVNRAASGASSYRDIRHGVLNAVSQEPHHTVYIGSFERSRLKYLDDHKVAEDVVVPGAQFVELLQTIADRHFEGEGMIASMEIVSACLLSEQTLELYCDLTTGASGRVNLEVHSKGQGSYDWQLHVKAELTKHQQVAAADFAHLSAAADKAVDIAALYRNARRSGVEYGSDFQVLGSLSVGLGCAAAQLTLPEHLLMDEADCGLHPVLLDGCFQSIAAAVGSEPAEGQEAILFVPARLHGVYSRRPAGQRLWCYCEIVHPDGERWQDGQALADYIYHSRGFTVKLWAFDQSGAEVCRIDEMEVKRSAALTGGKRWQDWIYQKQWQPDSTAGHRVFQDANALLDFAREQFGALSQAQGVDIFALQLEADALCAAYFKDALIALGVKPGEAVTPEQLVAQYGVGEQHRRLLANLLDVLVQSGFAEVREQGVALCDQDSQSVAELEREAKARYGEHDELALLMQCGQSLKAVLCNELNGVDIIFKRDHSDSVESVYKDAPGTRVLNGLIGKVALKLAQQLSEGRSLRILEIGAGTGATTGYVLEQLQQAGLTGQVRYTFSDISPYFLNAAKARFGDFDCLDYQLIDASKAVDDQWYGQFDLVIAVNVIHALPNLNQAAGHLNDYLCQGGVLLLRELTRQQSWLDLTFGLTPGWWAFEDAERRQRSPLLDTTQWCELLKARGFDAVLPTERDGSELEAVILALKQSAGESAGHHLVFAEDNAVCRGLIDSLKARGEKVSVVYRSQAAPADAHYQADFADTEQLKALFEQLSGDFGDITKVTYGWSLKQTEVESIEDAAALEPYAKVPLLLCQVLLEDRWRGIDSTFLTHSAQAVDTAQVDPLPTLLWGEIFAFINENGAKARLIDIDDNTDIDTLIQAMDVRRECQLVLRGQTRYLARLNRTALGAEPSDKPSYSPIAADGTYLITGGLGDLGLLSAERLAAKGARNIVLVGRSIERAKDNPAIDKLEAQGVSVHCHSIDVADSKDMQHKLPSILAELPPLKGVLHCVGVLQDGVFATQNWSRYLKVYGPKVLGTLLLHRLTKAMSLDFFVIYSSASAIFGNPGQSNHASANSFLDGFAWYRRGLGLPALSINWGAWSEIGAAEARNVTERLSRDNSIVGVISPKGGSEIIDRQFDCDLTQFAVIPLNTERTLDESIQPFVKRLLQPLFTHSEQARGDENEADIVSRLAAAKGPEREVILTDYLGTLAAALLNYPEAIGESVSLFDIGLDSLLAIDFRTRLEKQFALKLDSTLMFDYPNIRTLCAFLLGKLSDLSGRDAFVPSASKALPATAFSADKPSHAGIAVIGMACHFPGQASTLEDFWQLLVDARDTRQPIPASRWDNSLYYDEQQGKPGKLYVKTGCFIDDVDLFYPELYGISGVEAALMDPQQRLLLDTCHQSIEHAAIDPGSLKGQSVGVYMGVMTSDYFSLTRNQQKNPFYVGTGSANSVAAGRISHVFGLMGPTMTLDTACSSSLVGIQLASQDLKLGNCDMALAGGVNLQLIPETVVLECAGGMLSPTGGCKTFDAEADGFERGEGCGVVVLKRLEDALRDSDSVYGVVLGGAVTHDGKTGGLTVPSSQSQQLVIEKALASAGLGAADVDYVEAHGTGTQLGDPIELNALQATYGKRGDGAAKLLVGSVKTNIGHLEAAAGIAGFIKIMLCFEKGQWTPHRLSSVKTERFDWQDGCIELADAYDNGRGGKPAIAAISSFGLSGTNAHLLMGAPTLPVRAAPSEPGIPLAVSLSGVRPELVLEDAIRYADTIEHKSLHWLDTAYTLSASRSGFAFKTTLVAEDLASLLDQLRHLSKDDIVNLTAKKAPLWSLKLGKLSAAIDASGYYRHFDDVSEVFDIAAEKSGVPVETLLKAEDTFAQAIGALALASRLCALAGRPQLIDSDESMLPVAAYLVGAYDLSEAVAALDSLMNHPQSALPSADVAKVETPVICQVRSSALQALGDALGQVTPGTEGFVTQCRALQPAIGMPFASTIARLSQAGVAIDWRQYYEALGARRTALPNTRLPKKRYWLEPEQTEPTQVSAKPPLAFESLSIAGQPTEVINIKADVARLAFLHQHRLRDRNLLSGAAGLALAIEALCKDESAVQICLKSVSFNAAVKFDSKLAIQLQRQKDGQVAMYYSEDSHAESWRQFNGFTIASGRDALAPFAFDAAAFIEAAELNIDHDYFYRHFTPPNLVLGDAYRRLSELWRKGEEVLALLDNSASTMAVDPCLFDAIFQAVNFVEVAHIDPDALYLPHGVEQLALNRLPSGKLWCHVRYRSDISSDEQLIYDIKVMDENQAVVACFDTVGFRRVGAARQSQVYHQNRWFEASLASAGSMAVDESVLLVGDIASLTDNLEAKVARVEWQSDLGAKELKLAVPHCLEQHPDCHKVVVAVDVGAPQQFDTVAISTLVKQVTNIARTLSQWCQSCARHQRSLTIVTRNGLSIDPDAGADGLLAEAVSGLIKTAIKEYPGMWFKHLDADQLNADLWAQELASIDAPVVVYREGQRYLSKLQPLALERTVDFNILSDRSYLVTGGLGGIGLNVAKRLAELGAGTIILTSRRQRPELAPQLAQLRAMGSAVEVMDLDVSNARQVSELLGTIEKAHPPLAGVFHSAGVLANGLMRNLKVKDWQQVLAAKLTGALNLHQATREMPLDCFVLFSSVVAIGGSFGQSNYVVANALVDALAHYRRSLGLKALSINWGAWEHTGMAKQASDKGVQFAEGLSSATGIKALFELLSAELTQVAVYQPITAPSKGVDGKEQLSAEAIMQQARALKDAPPEVEQKPVEPTLSGVEALRRALAAFLNIDLHSIAADSLIFDLGMDSVNAVDFAASLSARYGAAISVDAIFDYPAVGDLAAFIDSQKPAPSESPQSADVAVGAPAAIDRETMQILLGNRLADFLNIDAAVIAADSLIFDIGMDSVNAVEFARQLGDELGIELAVDAIFDYPAVADLAEYIAGLHGQSAQPAASHESAAVAAVSENSPSAGAIGLLLKAELAAFLNIDETVIAEDSLIFDIGMDSVNAVDFAQSLSGRLSIDIAVDVIFDYPAVADLANHLAERLGEPVAVQNTPVAVEPVQTQAQQRPLDILVSELAAFLNIDATVIGPDSLIFDVGMDSVNAVDFAHKLGQRLGLDIAVDVIFDYPAIGDLANHLAERIGVQTQPEAPSYQPASEPVEDLRPEAIKALVGLSPEQQQDMVSEIVLANLAVFLNIDTAAISADSLIFDVGMDSVNAADFAQLLGERFGLNVPVDFIFDYPAVADLASSLCREIEAKGVLAVETNEPQYDSTTDELAAMLAAELSDS